MSALAEYLKRAGKVGMEYAKPMAREGMEYAKANPGKTALGAAGLGAAGYGAHEMMKEDTLEDKVKHLLGKLGIG